MTAPADTPAISTRGLSRHFGATAAVTGLDLEVRRGEMYALVGPDGAGKSTAVRLLCGILRADGGTAHVLGFDLRRAPLEVKKRIGYLSQDFTLYGDLTVDENLDFFADIHGVRDWRPRREELLEFTRLTPFRRRFAQALSGGMKKKLALACTLIHTPELMILDEPSTGVDPVSRGELWSILSGILARGVTILMTTPYLDEAERCHRVSLMHRGSVLMTGTPDEVRRAMPGHVYCVTCPEPGRAYRILRRRWPATSLVLYGDHLHFWTAGGEAEVSAVRNMIEQEGLVPVTVAEAPPTLEDAFVALLYAQDETAVPAALATKAVK